MTIETDKAAKPDEAEQERINTLVCQITDGFLRGDEQRADRDVRPFEELLTHLLPRSDVFTKCVVAQKLAKRSDVPRSVIDMLLNDEAPICEPLVFHSRLLKENDIDILINRHDPVLRSALLSRDDLNPTQRQSLLLNPSVEKTHGAHASSGEQIQISIPVMAAQPNKNARMQMQKLLSVIKPLMVAIPESAETVLDQAELIIQEQPTPMPQPVISARIKTILPQLVRAAVLRRQEELGSLIASEIDISPVIAQALLKDATGEALITACRHIEVPEDASIQIATLLYPGLTQSREQLISLRALYRHLTPKATQRIANAWRTLQSQTSHETVHSPAKTVSFTPASPATQIPAKRQEASNQ